MTEGKFVLFKFYKSILLLKLRCDWVAGQNRIVTIVGHAQLENKNENTTGKQ